MAMAKQPRDVRQRAEWMVRSDDDVLEVIHDEGNLTPRAIEEFGGPTAHHAGQRARKLAAVGLLNQISHGLYRLTDEGRAYLNEELDATTLPNPDDEQ